MFHTTFKEHVTIWLYKVILTAQIFFKLKKKSGIIQGNKMRH